MGSWIWGSENDVFFKIFICLKEKEYMHERTQAGDITEGEG